MTDELRSATPVERQLCDAAALAKILDVSVRTVRRLDDTGQLPGAINLRGCKRWRVEEIQAWVRAGAPPRRKWRNPA